MRYFPSHLLHFWSSVSFIASEQAAWQKTLLISRFSTKLLFSSKNSIFAVPLWILLCDRNCSSNDICNDHPHLGETLFWAHAWLAILGFHLCWQCRLVCLNQHVNGWLWQYCCNYSSWEIFCCYGHSDWSILAFTPCWSYSCLVWASTWLREIDFKNWRATTRSHIRPCSFIIKYGWEKAKTV